MSTPFNLEPWPGDGQFSTWVDGSFYIRSSPAPDSAELRVNGAPLCRCEVRAVKSSAKGKPKPAGEAPTLLELPFAQSPLPLFALRSTLGRAELVLYFQKLEGEVAKELYYVSKGKPKEPELTRKVNLVTQFADGSTYKW